MAINIDKDLLNQTTNELLDLLNDKEYKESIKMVNKEIRYIRDQLRRNEKMSSDTVINDYIIQKENKKLKDSLKELNEFKNLIRKAEKNPKYVRLNKKLQKFNEISQKNNIRKANIKYYRSTKKYYSNLSKEAIEIFYIRGFIENENFIESVSNIPLINDFFIKYFGETFANKIKESFQNVAPDRMSNDTAYFVSKLSAEYIDKIKNIDVSNEDVETAVKVQKALMNLLSI